ncbi:MAG: helix-turn-helix transcriptional regulator [Microbacteriaceae bacterium]|nr:helix-turn-helix transcriptional regulator [Microbacteriaceae bacterium]
MGNRIKNVRKTARLTQQQLADLAGISDRTLRALEQGTGSPSIAAFIAVCEVLGLEIEAR